MTEMFDTPGVYKSNLQPCVVIKEGDNVLAIQNILDGDTYKIKCDDQEKMDRASKFADGKTVVLVWIAEDGNLVFDVLGELVDDKPRSEVKDGEG